MFWVPVTFVPFSLFTLFRFKVRSFPNFFRSAYFAFIPSPILSLPSCHLVTAFLSSGHFALVILVMVRSITELRSHDLTAFLMSMCSCIATLLYLRSLLSGLCPLARKPTKTTDFDFPNSASPRSGPDLSKTVPVRSR